MDKHISWIAELRIKAGRKSEFRTLTREMVDATKEEPGALIYERFIDSDQNLVYVHERYVDSDSAAEHLLNFRQKFGKRFSDVVDRERFTVFGSPSEQLIQLLDGFNAEFVGPFDGFSRF